MLFLWIFFSQIFLPTFYISSDLNVRCFLESIKSLVSCSFTFSVCFLFFRWAISFCPSWSLILFVLFYSWAQPMCLSILSYIFHFSNVPCGSLYLQILCCFSHVSRVCVVVFWSTFITLASQFLSKNSELSFILALRLVDCLLLI